jgi:NitT/TauT family transport system ATP-binding protein
MTALQQTRTTAPIPVTEGQAISAKNISVRYQLKRGTSVLALDDVSLEIAPGEFVALIGPSGCGKSTFLRVVAALEQASSGTITVGGVAPSAVVSEHRLGVGFQDSALLPWLSVRKNLELPFKLAGRPVEHERIAEFVGLVGLTGFEDARPKQLSGGMRQRVSIARSLMLEPSVLLLDEPFGALDAVTRRRMNNELQRIWTEQAVTTLLVTHDVDEAVYLADRVIVMTGRPGRIAIDRRIGFERPRTEELTRMPEFHEIVDELTVALDHDAARADR